MSNKRVWVLVGGGFALAFLSLVALSFTGDKPEVLEAAAQPTYVDPQFGGDTPKTVEGKKSDEWLHKQTTYHPATGNRRVVKTVYSNRRGGHLHPVNHFIQYDFFREDGTIERSRMVYADDNQLAASIYAVYRETTFDENEKEVDQRYIRRDGTLAHLSKGGDHFEYRADGKTLRRDQKYQGDDLVETRYRLDGTTVWFRTTYGKKQTTTEVFFDQDGNPYEKKFVRKALVKSFGFGPDSADLATEHHDYQRADGTLEYRQVWYCVWDKSLDTSRDALGEVEVYAADGKTLKAVYVLDRGTSPVVQKSTTYDDSGARTERTFRAANCRAVIDRFDAKGESLGRETFPSDDFYMEKVDPRLFHGFTVDIYGTYDDDSHDK